MNTRAINEKAITYVALDITTTTMVVNSHMIVIQVQIDINTIDDVILDGGFEINIITKQLKVRLGLSKPQPAPYNLRMANQTITTPK